MAEDPLAKFRRSQLAEAASPQVEEQGGLPEYQAFDTGGKLKRLQIRRAMGAFHCPAYVHLLDIVSDGWHGSEIVLVFSFMLVKIKGRNLNPLTLALQQGACDFIQDYDPRFFQDPKQDDPVIENIEIVAQQGG